MISLLWISVTVSTVVDNKCLYVAVMVLALFVLGIKYMQMKKLNEQTSQSKRVDCLLVSRQENQPLQNILVHKKAFIQNTTLSYSYKILNIKCNLRLLHMYLFTVLMSGAPEVFWCVIGRSALLLFWWESDDSNDIGPQLQLYPRDFDFRLRTSFVLLFSLHVAQTELLLPDEHQRVSAAVPLQRLDQESTYKGEREIWWKQRSLVLRHLPHPPLALNRNCAPIHVCSLLQISHDGGNMLPSVGTCTEAHPAGDHMYSLPFPVHSAKRGRLGSHWKQRAADVCSSTASKLIFCRSHTHTAVAMLSAGRDREGERRWQEFPSFRRRKCSDLPFLVAR